MLNLFPSLLTFSFFAPTLLRISAAIIFLSCALVHWRRRHELRALFAPILSPHLALPSAVAYAIIELIAAALLFVGLYTQAAAILGMVLALKYAVLRPRVLAPFNHATDWLLFIICLSLLFTGAGAFAFDIPL